jgi:Mn-dependent DtxR family transcriptional regulator
MLIENSDIGGDKMNFNESSEDYLESILMLREQLGKVRSIDIVYKLGYSKPSISIAMKKLREKGLINMDAEGYITLTDEGAKIARHTYTRHKVLTNFFESIGVGHNNAEADACKIEHDISDETFKRLKEHMHRLQELDISPKAAAFGNTPDTD